MYIHIYTHIYVHKYTSQKECLHIFSPSALFTFIHPPWKWVVGRLLSFWDGFLAGAMWVSGSVNPHDSASMSELSTSAALARSAQEAKYLGDRALTQSPITLMFCLLYPSLIQKHCRCRPVQSSQASNQIIYCTIDIPVPSERPPRTAAWLLLRYASTGARFSWEPGAPSG